LRTAIASTSKNGVGLRTVMPRALFSFTASCHQPLAVFGRVVLWKTVWSISPTYSG